MITISRSKAVLTIDCWCKKYKPPTPAPHIALQELMPSRANCGPNSFSGRHFGPLPLFRSVVRAATAAAADSETVAGSFVVNVAITRSRVRSLPGERGSARKPSAATDTPPE